jgi:hypothetical protein
MRGFGLTAGFENELANRTFDATINIEPMRKSELACQVFPRRFQVDASANGRQIECSSWFKKVLLPRTFAPASPKVARRRGFILL